MHQDTSAGDNKIAREKVRPQVVTSQPKTSESRHYCDNLRDTLDRNTTVVPFRQRLRLDAKQPGEGRLRPAPPITPIERPVHRDRVLHSRLKLVNPEFNCTAPQAAYNNKLMVDKSSLPKAPPPGEFQTFSDWIKAVCSVGYGTKSLVARAVDAKPQALNRWITNGSIPRAKTLRKLADVLGVSYPELLLLANGGGPAPAPGVSRDTATAELLAVWQHIEDGATRSVIISHVRALAQLQQAESTKRVNGGTSRKRRT